LVSAAAALQFVSVNFNGAADQDLTSNVPLVLPGGNLPMSVRLLNNGTTTLDSSQFVLYSTFGNLTTKTTGQTAGQSANFSGVLGPFPKKPTVLTVKFDAYRDRSSVVSLYSFFVEVEVSCSGPFCDGAIQFFINETCQSAPYPTCPYDIDNCAVSSCSADTRQCKTDWISTSKEPGCTQCIRCETWTGCDGKQCGSDGCHGLCGLCPSGLYCSEGSCIEVQDVGTCTNPHLLFQNLTDLSGIHFVNGDNYKGYSSRVSKCNAGSTSKESVYSFVVPENQSYGIDVRSYGNGMEMDTVLDVYKNNCSGTYVGCNDDGSPPGDYGSRVARLIGPGTYFVMVKGYDQTVEGNFTLRMSFVRNCIPKCNSIQCGDDACGSQCGECSSERFCSTNGRCELKVCTPDCTDNECGLDGCGGFCGTCTDGKLCNTLSNKCQSFPQNCDSFNPVCASGCNATEYCAADCQCYNADAPLADLYVDQSKLMSDVYIDSDTFSNNSCAWVEGCVTAPGLRRLLRFTVQSVNQGRAPMKMGLPEERPDLFVYSPCHGHYHFTEYALYSLFSADRKIKIEQGRKQGYCLEDGVRVHDGATNCAPSYTCTNQGISPGWADAYTADIDCQWIDITDVPPGNYTLSVELNPKRKMVESDYSNNKASVLVNVPVWDKTKDPMVDKTQIPVSSNVEEGVSGSAAALSVGVLVVVSAMIFA